MLLGQLICSFQFPFRSIAVRFNWTEFKWKLITNRTDIEQERNGNGTELEREWSGNGTGTEREWSWNGIEREWNGNGTKFQRMDNGSSIKGSQLVYNRITGQVPWTEHSLSVHWIFVPFLFHSRSVPFPLHSSSIPVPFPFHSRSIPFPVLFHSCSIPVPVLFHSRSFPVQLNRTAMERNGNWKKSRWVDPLCSWGTAISWISVGHYQTSSQLPIKYLF